MRLILKPNNTSLDLLLETSRYKRGWRKHSRAILAAFRNITGLEFQQTVITARVHQDSLGNAGTPRHPMHLPGDYDSEQQKLITLVHELSHRLLGGNALGPIAIGLLPDTDDPQPEFQEYEHRHTYLFEYDVIESSLGAEYAKLCRDYEESNNIDGPHDRAWAWAMSMSRENRQRAVKLLAAEALPKNRWHERDDGMIEPRDPLLWFERLHNSK